MSHKAQQFFDAATPTPNQETLEAQFRNMAEEMAEGLVAIKSNDGHVQSLLDNAIYYLNKLSECVSPMFLHVPDDVALLDGLADIGVATHGLAHNLGYDYVGAKDEVDSSNLTKVVDGTVTRSASGKITKPEGFEAPNLEQYIH